MRGTSGPSRGRWQPPRPTPGTKQVTPPLPFLHLDFHDWGIGEYADWMPLAQKRDVDGMILFASGPGPSGPPRDPPPGPLPSPPPRPVQPQPPGSPGGPPREM